MYSWAMLCTVGYMLGVLSSGTVGFSVLVLFAGCILISSVICSLFTKKFKPLIPLFALLLVFGSFRAYTASEEPIYQYFPEKYITVTGTIASTPAKTAGNYGYRSVLHTKKVKYLEQNPDIDTKIIVYTKEPLRYGDKVSISGFLNVLEGRENEYEYDYSAYYKSIGISARITAMELEHHGKTPFYLNPIAQFRQLVYDNILKSGKNAGYFLATILDDNSVFSDETTIMLRKTGFLQLLYSPYMHLSMLMLLSGIFFRGKRVKAEGTVFFFLILYTLLNSHSPSLLKGCFLAALVIFSRNITGTSDRLRLFFLLVLVFTIIEPLLCYNSCFMFSVISTYMFSVSFEPIYERLSPVFNKLRLPHNNLRKLPVAWFILVVGTMPFAAYYFGTFSPYTTLITPIIMPFILIILLLSPLLFIIPGAYTFLSSAANTANSAAESIERIAEFTSRLPLSNNMLTKPSVLFLVCWCLIWWLIVRAADGKLSTVKSKAIGAVLSVFLICTSVFNIPGTLEIYFVNVGQGDGAVLHTNKGDTVLIDGGGSTDEQSGYNIGERLYLPYLISHGFCDIDVAVLSHYHKDHAEGIIAAAENLKINTLVMPDTTPDNTYRKHLEEIARVKDIKIEYLMQSDEIRFDSGLVLKVLSPDKSQLNAEDENDTSLVISAEFGEFTALFTGDSSVPATSLYPTQTDILKTSHHGSKTATSQEFIDWINPDYAVISVGRGNSYNLPSHEVLDRLKSSGACILRTDTLGDIRFKIDKHSNISYRTLKNEER